MDLIARANNGITYTTTPGTMVGVSLDLGNKQVIEISPLTLKFSPKHEALKDDSKLKIEFQEALEVPCPDKTVDNDYALNSIRITKNFEATCGKSVDD